jgi:hypothetical protein
MKIYHHPVLNLLVLLIIICAMSANGQTPNVLRLDSNAVSPPATIADFSFIIGSWFGPALGGICYEVWSEPSGETMAGTFKMVTDDQVGFYELMVIAPAGESYAMLLKHFNADMTGWEEKDEVVTFPLVKIENETAYFDGLTMRRTHPDSLEVFVLAGSGDKQHELVFIYSRDSKK